MIKINCSNCGKNLEAPDDAAGRKGKCNECGAVFVVTENETAKIIPLEETINTKSLKKDYKVLRSISVAFEIFAWVHFLAAVVFSIYVFFKGSFEIEGHNMFSSVTVSYAPMAIPILIIAAIAFVLYYALAECIRVFLDIESNTRKAAEMAEASFGVLKRRK